MRAHHGDCCATAPHSSKCKLLKMLAHLGEYRLAPAHARFFGNVAIRTPITALITATTSWPLSARLAMRLIVHGCSVAALCPRGHVLNQVSGIGAVHSYSSLDSMAALENTIASVRPNIVIPCDDRAVWQLHELHETRPQFRRLIETSLGASEHYRTVRSRSGVIEIAGQMGVRVPETGQIRSQEEIRDWISALPGPSVLKLDGTWGGSGVEIIRSVEEGLAVWRKFTEPEPVGLAWKRWLINRDPLAFWRGGVPAVSMQRFIPGEPANAMVACWQGEVLGMISVEVLCTQGATGSSTIVRVIRNGEMAEAARSLARGLRLSGFYGLDFILDRKTAAAYLIEINPRCTQLGHLVLPDQGDLVSLICARLGACGPGRADTPIEGDTIAFFPQALAWSPNSPYLQHCHHDVPWSEPELVRELLRDPWPERRWLARAYHRLRGKKRTNPLPDAKTVLRLAAVHGLSAAGLEGVLGSRRLLWRGLRRLRSGGGELRR